VDVERGIVFAFVMFDQAGAARSVKLSDRRVVQSALDE
jgi:hypothetical protein